jgi:hypothetical protein
MTSLAHLMNTLSHEGISVWLDGEQVCYRAPKGALSPERAAELRERRPELRDFLRQAAPSLLGPELCALGVPGPYAASYAQRVFVNAYPALVNPAVQTSWIAKRLIGPLQVDLLQQCFATIVTRHPALRTRYSRDTSAALFVHISETPDVIFRSIVIAPADGGTGGDDVTPEILAAVKERFDLAAGPLLRVHLLQLSPEDHVLVVVAHHSISDAWSLGVIMRELATIYRAFLCGEQPVLPALSIQYTDFTNWLFNWVESADGQSHLNYWRRLIANARGPFDLPVAPPNAPTVESLRTGFTLRDATLTPLRAMARERGDTLSNIAMAALAVALARWRGHPDVFIKIVHHGRLRSELHDMVGCFVGCSIIRVNLGGSKDFRDVLDRVRSAHREALPHLQAPWFIVRAEMAKLPAEQQLADIHFNYRSPALGFTRSPGHARVDDTGGLMLEDVALPPGVSPLGPPDSLEEATGMLLNINIVETPTSLICAVRYMRSRLAASQVDMFCRSLENILVSVARSGGSSPLSV